MLVDHRVVHATDRLLDPGDLAAGRIGGAGGGGRLGPVPEDRPGSVHFLPGPDDGDDLDGSALSLERVPEAAVPAAPRAERGRGLVAGLGVDEHGTGVIERHRQFDWEIAACASGGSPVDPDRQESALDAE